MMMLEAVGGVEKSLEDNVELGDCQEEKGSRKKAVEAESILGAFEELLCVAEEGMEHMSREEKWNFAMKNIPELGQVAKMMALLGRAQLEAFVAVVTGSSNLLEAKKDLHKKLDKAAADVLKNSEVRDVFIELVGDEKKAIEARRFINSFGLTEKKLPQESVSMFVQKFGKKK